MLPVTADLEKTMGKIKRFPEVSTSHPEFDRAIWKNRMVEKHRLFHSKTYPLLEEEAENTDLNELREWTHENIEYGSDSGRGQIGIISSGSISSVVERALKKHTESRAGIPYPEISHLSLSLVNPLPLEKIKAFLKGKQKVLVAEESEPFIEEQIRIAGNIYGKKTGHLPYGQVRLEDLEFALDHIGEEVLKPAGDAVLKAGSRASICNDCPYLPLYRFLSMLEVRVAGDMGCSVRSAPEPLAAVDVSFALGSAISVACGFEEKGIAVIGDFALAHSGILGLLSAATMDCNVLVLVLQNEVAAMTGGQIVPDIRKVIASITPDVSDFDIDASEEEASDKVEKPGDGTEKVTGRTENENKAGHEVEKQVLSPGLSELIRTKLALPGISVIFIKGKCRKY